MDIKINLDKYSLRDLYLAESIIGITIKGTKNLTKEGLDGAKLVESINKQIYDQLSAEIARRFTGELLNFVKNSSNLTDDKEDL